MDENEKLPRELREDLIEGRNAVAEAIRAGRTIDKLFVARGETDRTLSRITAKPFFIIEPSSLSSLASTCGGRSSPYICLAFL